MKNSASFRYLWIGQSMANLGDVLYIVGLVTIVYEATGLATYMALIPFSITSAQLVSGLTAPLIIDRFRLKPILVYSQLGKTILFVVMTLFSLFFLTPSTILFIFPLVMLISFLDGWATPIRNAFVPRLVESDYLVKANSLLSITDQTIRLVGLPVGSLLVTVIGGGNILWLTFLLFTFSTGSMGLIQHVTVESQKNTNPKTSKWDTLKEGWVAIWKSPPLRIITIIDFLQGIAAGIWASAILYVYVGEVLNRGKEWWGFINGSLFAGMIVGGVLVLKASKYVDKQLGVSIVLGSVGTSLLTLWFGLTSSPWLALLLIGVMGLFQQLRDTAKKTAFQKSLRDHLLPQAFSAQGTLIYGTFGLSVLILGYLTDLFGVKFAFITAASLIGLSALWAVIKTKELTPERYMNSTKTIFKSN